MNTFELKLFDDEGNACTLYSVRWADATLSETEKFLEKYQNDRRLAASLEVLTQFVYQIADTYGAQIPFFRFEDLAHALPPPGKKQFAELNLDFGNAPLRLYCLRISDQLLVLFNGAEKTSQSALEGATSMAFREANLFAGRIIEALRCGEIRESVDGRYFETDSGNDDIEL